MKRTWPITEPCGTQQVRGDEGELCGGIPIVGVRDERYEVNHRSKTEEIPNQVKDGRVGWSGREYQKQLIDEEDKDRRLVAWKWHWKMVV